MGYLNEVRETLEAVALYDLATASLDELIDTKRQLEDLVRSIESQLQSRSEGITDAE